MADSAKNRKFNTVFDWFDQGRDGYLSEDDFHHMAALFTALPGGDAPENAKALHDAFGKWWSLLLAGGDSDGDGSLSFDEYVRMYDGLGIDSAHSSDAFRRLDRDGDGALSYQEFRTAITEFYLSDDENAPGNWLLGPLD